MRTLFMFLLAAMAAGAWGAEYQFKHQEGVSLTLLRDGKPVWNYHYAPADNTPYFDVLAVAGGPNMVAFMPVDHPWHRGLWWAWKYVNDVNFWDWTEAHGNRPKWPGKTPHEPDGKSKLQGKEEVVLGDAGQAVIEMELGYGYDQKIIMKEARRIAISRPDEGGTYRLDWSSTFKAQGEKVVFDRTPPKPTTGGYAGLGLRAPAEMQETAFTNSLGATGQDCRGQNAAWVDMTGVMDAQFGPAGVAIFDHPQNPRHPTAWHVQAKPPYYYFNPALVYYEPFTLEAGKELALRYRLLIHKGKVGAEDLNKELKAFGKESN